MQLEIQGTSVTPEISFDIKALSFKMRGRSMPEDAEKFYNRIILWLLTNVGHTGIKANFDVEMDYYNTGSFIRLMALFNTLEELNRMDNYFEVRWYCEEADQDNIDDALSFKDVVQIPFEIIIVPELK